MKEGKELFPKVAENKFIFSDVSYTETWPAMEKLVEKGLVKSIGVSNFNSKQVDDILKIAKIPPVVNQVECHPYLNQKKLKEFCECRGVKLEAYAPLGSPNRPWVKKDDPNLLTDPKILEIAKKNNKTPAQILVRYQIQRDNIVIVKSVTKERIVSNFQVFDFNLDSSDMEKLDSLDRKLRFYVLEWDSHHKDYPFHCEY